jgi:hypothetical protein
MDKDTTMLCILFVYSSFQFFSLITEGITPPRGQKIDLGKAILTPKIPLIVGVKQG